MCRGLIVILLAAALAGCGGSGGLPVGGTVNVDGQPLPWGQIYLRGEVDKSSTTNQLILEVRDGRFTSSTQGLPAGDYGVTVLVHEGAAPPPPAEGAEEAEGAAAKVTGVWEGRATVAEGQELSIQIPKSEVQKPS